jgi:hypothetical protein
MRAIWASASPSAQDQDAHRIGQLANGEFSPWPMRV